MVIAGALAGLGGGLLYLSGASGRHIKPVDVLAPEGFNGIPVALLGLSNPIGIIFSAIFISYITLGGNYLQTLDFVPEIIDIIIACIIYFSAFALIFRNILPALLKWRLSVAEKREASLLTVMRKGWQQKQRRVRNNEYFISGSSTDHVLFYPSAHSGFGRRIH